MDCEFVNVIILVENILIWTIWRLWGLSYKTSVGSGTCNTIHIKQTVEITYNFSLDVDITGYFAVTNTLNGLTDEAN